jgi:hypothetical protein
MELRGYLRSIGIGWNNVIYILMRSVGLSGGSMSMICRSGLKVEEEEVVLESRVKRRVSINAQNNGS